MSFSTSATSEFDPLALSWSCTCGQPSLYPTLRALTTDYWCWASMLRCYSIGSLCLVYLRNRTFRSDYSAPSRLQASTLETSTLILVENGSWSWKSKNSEASLGCCCCCMDSFVLILAQDYQCSDGCRGLPHTLLICWTNNHGLHCLAISYRLSFVQWSCF